MLNYESVLWGKIASVGFPQYTANVFNLPVLGYTFNYGFTLPGTVLGLVWGFFYSDFSYAVFQQQIKQSIVEALKQENI